MDKGLALELVTDCIRNVSTLTGITIGINCTLDSLGISPIELKDFVNEIEDAIECSDYIIP